MSLFSRHLGSDASFHPLFRLLDDYETYSRGSPSGARGQKSHLPSFQPKFDVRELEDAFELHGELAGISKENVSIEFTDPHTLHISGRVERSYTSGTPPAGLLQGRASGGTITESGESQAQSTTESGHKATVEDETAESSGSTDAHEESTSKENAASDAAKYWLSERSVGEFSRSFSFPGLIQQDSVSANLKDGVLTVRIPKTPKNGSRHRIQIN